ncbi:hypothetical protein FXO37_14891 [Capsicum annuum]|nr:hypothetical protein FXO37_14891 [Capsicum annuum]
MASDRRRRHSDEKGERGRQAIDDVVGNGEVSNNDHSWFTGRAVIAAMALIPARSDHLITGSEVVGLTMMEIRREKASLAAMNFIGESGGSSMGARGGVGLCQSFSCQF